MKTGVSLSTESRTDQTCWIALSLLPDVGPARARKLLSVFANPEMIFRAGFDDLRQVDGIGAVVAKKIRDFSSWGDIGRQISEMEAMDIKVISLQESSYPEMLKEIDDAPVVIYARGDILPNDKFAIAIVGSRRLTQYGTSVAEKISEDLAACGFTVVSGMARGVDSISHRGALRAGGRTIAVLGSGLDIPYPPENKTLMEDIVKSGCALSEFPPGTPPEKENFPRRNRLISALSLGVLVVEATLDSGALITARYAAEQGREVFAVPGNITSRCSEGTNELLRRGAILVRRAEDIVEELAPVLKGFLRTRDNIRENISDEEKRLCNLLSGEPKQIDVISRESGLASSKALGILLGLELKGAVKQITGKRFYLA
jgi:DNA processing protein